MQRQRLTSQRSQDSMRKKSMKKSASKEIHRTNFVAGRVPIDLHSLTRVGLRGRKAYIAMAIFVLLCLLALAELVWTCVILSVLNADTKGLPSMQFLSDGGLRFTQPTESSEAVIGEFIGAFQDSNLTISGARDQNPMTNASVTITSNHGTMNSVPQRSELGIRQVGGVSVSSANAFDISTVTQAADGTRVSQSYFRVTKSVVTMPVPDRAARLQARLIITPKVSSPPGVDFLINSAADQVLDITSISGVEASGQQVTLDSSVMKIQATQGVTLAAGGSLQVDSSTWSIGNESTSSQATQETVVCACVTSASQTLLFRVPSTPERCRLQQSDLPAACQ